MSVSSLFYYTLVDIGDTRYELTPLLPLAIFFLSLLLNTFSLHEYLFFCQIVYTYTTFLCTYPLNI